MSRDFPAPFARVLLARHRQSEANAQNIFTGWSDPPLTATGRAEAQAIASRLQSATTAPARIFSSSMRRAVDTVEIICKMMASATSVTADAALNERDYGELTGLNKAEAEQCFGADRVHTWRRSYALAPPGGESLRDTAARVLSYYVRTLLPAALAGGTTLVVAHGNSLRALVMALRGMSPEEVENLEIPTGTLLSFELAASSALLRHASID